MFNKTQFNRTIFNRTILLSNDMYAEIRSDFGFTVSQLRILAEIPKTIIASDMAALIKPLGMSFPLPSVILGARYDILSDLYIYRVLPDTIATCKYELIPNALRSVESDEMTLEGLDLKPGQTLIIDTDTLEIEIDGETRVDAWVIGGSFFQFKNGDNVLSFNDNANNRNLDVTIIWADRYL